MHFALRGYLFIALTALLGVAGTWSDVPAFSGAWLLPAFLLLSGLALMTAGQLTDRRYGECDDFRTWALEKVRELDPDVLAFLKRDGKGWQTRMNAILRDVMTGRLKARKRA